MNLTVNTVIEWFHEDAENEEPILEKILWIEQTSNIGSSNKVIVVRMSENNALPFIRSNKEITQAFNSELARILVHDPYEIKFIKEEDIENKYRMKRDERYKIISEIVELRGIEAYIPHIRGKIIRKLVAEKVAGKKLIYHLLRKWWKGGQTKNALLPHFKQCGGAGKRRTGKSRDEKKLGRPSNGSRFDGKSRGIRITEKDEQKFAKAIDRFYELQKRKSLVQAYKQLLIKFYNTGYEKKDGIFVPILPPAEELPTLKQFRYWYDSVYCDPVRKIKKRFGENAFNLKHREILGDATSIAFGPGSVYQVDATIADIYVVNYFNRLKIIGRPVIYVVIDVFSRMIAGVAVLLVTFTLRLNSRYPKLRNF